MHPFKKRRLIHPLKMVLILLAVLLVLATALPLLRFDAWWIRILDFPRGQIAVFGIVLVAAYLYFWETKRVYESVVLGLLVLAVGYQVVKMFPYTVLMPNQVLAAQSPSGSTTLKLLVANVLMGNRESKAIWAHCQRSFEPGSGC